MKKIVFIIVAAICIALLASCGKPEQAKVEQLSAEEITRANDAFASLTEVDGVNKASEISCFFTSFYDKPEEINLAEFLRYCPARERLEDTNSEEYASILEIEAKENPEIMEFPEILGPIYRYEKEDISNILKTYSNITADDLANLDGIIYLEKFDAFYISTSDFAPGSFECVGGEKIGDTIRLWSATDETGKRVELTLTVVNENYYIQSFKQVNE